MNSKRNVQQKFAVDQEDQICTINDEFFS